MANKLKWINHKSTFFEILKAQRGTSKYTDATLAVDGKFYPVHKLVMSTCSEYFSEIFERTACKSPVIVLKDVQSQDIEALLDYIYVGEVDVKQDDLTSLLKTAECLRIKGLGIPDERYTKSLENTINSDDIACAQPRSPPSKRRRQDSNAAMNKPNQSPQTLNISDNNKQEDDTFFVKVEVDDSMEEEVRFRKEDIYEEDIQNVHDPCEVIGYTIPKKEYEPENYDCAPLPGSSSQQKITGSGSSSRQKENLIVKVGLETATKEPDLEVRPQHNFEGGGASNNCDPLGGGNGSYVYNTEHNQEYYGGSTSLPGSYSQQSMRKDRGEQIPKTTKRTYTGKLSKVWEVFKKVQEGKKTECTICGNQYAYGGGSTTTLQRHIENKHTYIWEIIKNK